ncbi:MAG: PAS domain-containing protein [Candidatus Thorarchaeota archaeon]
MDILGYDVDEFIGMSVLDTIIPEDHDKMISETEYRKKGKQSLYETKIVRKDGTIRNVRISALPSRNNQGQLIGTIGLLIDVSEAKRAREELVVSEKRLRNLIERLPLGIAIADLDETIGLVNQAFADMLLHEQTTIIGRKFTDYLDSEQMTRILNETEDRKY